MNPRKDLTKFERQLRAVAHDITGWPFICDGSPFDCEIFLVGINPATKTRFWPYWSAKTGVNRDAWLQAYLNDGPFTQTRKRINWLVEATAPARVLETNVFPNFAPRERDLAKHLRTTKVFDFLIETLKPRIVFVHGRSAARHLERLASVSLKRGYFKTVNYKGTTFDLLRDRHLFNWSRQNVVRLGNRLRDREIALCQ